MSNANIEQLCAYIEKNKAKTYPIKNEMLEEETDYLINGYFKMLAVILQQAGEVTDAQYFLYQRMIAGTSSENSAEDYFRMAMEIEVEDYLKFTAELKEIDLSYRFILDAMILTCVSPKNPEQLKLVAEFCEALEVDKEDVKTLTAVARTILCMDGSGVVDMLESGFPESVFSGYTDLLPRESVMKNSETTIFYPVNESDVTMERMRSAATANTPNVKMIAVTGSLSAGSLRFENKKLVVLDGCNFHGGGSSIYFKNCEEVLISNCSFKDFTARTIQMENVKYLKIDNSSFEDCVYQYSNTNSDWKALGGVLHSNSVNSNEIVIEQCLFDRCGGINECTYYRSAFISNSSCTVKKSEFKNCWHYSCLKNRDPQNEKRTMFAKGSVAIDCTFENSADFC